MAKIFDVQDELHESPNRANHDLTHKRHMTGKFGVIYPFLAQPIVPTDSWELDTAIGVNLMPMWYPTQSNMRFIVHYFYVPNRLLMKNWKNTLEGLEEHEFPYLDAPADFYKTGSLADYLGIPTNLILPQSIADFANTSLDSRESVVNYFIKSLGFNVGASFKSIVDFADTQESLKISGGSYGIGWIGREPLLPFGKVDVERYGLECVVKADVNLSFAFENPANKPGVALLLFSSDKYFDCTRSNISDYENELKLAGTILLAQNLSTGDHFTGKKLSDEEIDLINGIIGNSRYVYGMFVVYRTDTTDQTIYSETTNPTGFSYSVVAGTNVEISEHPLYCPYYSTGHTTNTEKIRSFAFRAYEMCYNAYYRNSQGVQPFVVDGSTKYNEYLTTDADGADTTHYELKSRNWELDAYTSCLPSPQQGDAPLIGVTVDGSLRVQHDDGRVSTARLRDLEGSAGLETITTSIDPDHPEDARTIVSLASSGMTIADFRQGNALQRFLEQSLRSGFRYADFIFGHFGKAPTHQELDMPIFLGGYTQVVDTMKVTNVSAPIEDGMGSPLGQFAGQGSSFGSMKHNIKHYFDDFGIVLGLVTLVPDAAYSQVLPKHFTYSNRLDFFFPQFSQLGLQPITYEELCPIQSYFEYVNGDSSKLLTDTFGYQRPNHDLVWIPDTCHGLFRNSLAGSVINRRFGTRPTLGDDFLKIKPEECNDIFSVIEKNDDVWIGQVVCKITAQRPIPRIVIPSLGR